MIQHLFVTTVSGKEDLDLGPNDLHLDDFLLSGKFDLIAYADPELNLEEKKDMFNEELDLGEVAAEEKEGGAKKADHLVKQEVQECPAVAQRGGVCPSAASVVLSKVRSFQSSHHPASPLTSTINALPPLKVEESASGTAAVPVIQPQVNAAALGMSSQVHPPSAGGKLSGLLRQAKMVSLTGNVLLFLFSSVGCPAETVWLPLVLPGACLHLPCPGSPRVLSH